ncbi:hypothetical protein [Bathycoccus sp. RCC716 virus 1]|uniref:Minor capsid protein P9 transmembrane helices domain-containing protein n=1 Tax=Bathycoccus sp. RCC716 virus 1 TaxID=2530038 RepID=A0A7S6SWS6_9PHYC|nr:hypothetical protein [Bathycoccus sp. RCC716 virus 1]
MASWFEDPKQLVRVDKVHEFWPSKSQTSADRVNASARFIIYASCIIYLIKRDPRIFVLGATALGVLYIMEKSDMVREKPDDSLEALETAIQKGNTPSKYNNIGKPCTTPTKENPMGNVLISDYIDRPDRPQSCHYPNVKASVNDFITGDIKYGPARSRSSMPEYQRNALSRQFISMPDTSLGNTPYYEFIHGKRSDTCRQNPLMCNPNARGVQLEAFAGLAPNGDARITASRPSLS